MELPISLKIENSKGKILSTVNLVGVEYNLPAFILEGVLADILSDVRTQAKIEILNDVNALLNDKSSSEKTTTNEAKKE